LIAALEHAHFTGSEIEHILYKNVMRFYREMLVTVQTGLSIYC